ncbi:phospholipase D-like domain-containing protein [Opitutus terrae]|uniref:phospholipase D n=1 Tax=Opitutus terrae (strain DSM 11246 / JCM 15787 / PB90-1) TaxID=452637 RepID=B1ZU52_OPITP|nr:phospholipase D-like domain-containing protein [Opitutus terrae]ACB76618.1 phospholipase D/Transphosphatidylase [Opitutus terrae PB90-1]
MSNPCQVRGRNPKALFSLKLHRGDGMTLLAMNWRRRRPPLDFVGFAIEYQEPGGTRFYALNNRLSFAADAAKPKKLSTRLSPIQKFRWVHFPRNAELDGDFTYRATPVFMDAAGKLSYGEPQEAAIQLRRETYPGQLNVTYTRGFVSSQAFADRYGKYPLTALLPATADQGLEFQPGCPEKVAKGAYAWMGFEARSAVLEVLDQALGDPQAQVRVVAYDLCEPGIVSRLEQLGTRLKIIIDDSKPDHGAKTSAEAAAERRLIASAGPDHVKRQHVRKLQHNKIVVVDGPAVQAAVAGSTNFSWRGFYVQNNSAVILRGPSVVRIFTAAFEAYWNNARPEVFGATASAGWQKLGLKGIKAAITFSPRLAQNAVLASIAADLAQARSSLFFSLAFLYQTPGRIVDALKQIQSDAKIFCYGISDKKVKALAAPGLALTKPSGQMSVVYPQELTRDLAGLFKEESSGGRGVRLHHKFLVIDFDKPTARVYVGSFNFSGAADTSNGENLLCIRDRRVATSYMIEALRIFDHYHFRVAQKEAKAGHRPLQLARPPRAPDEKPWWDEYYSDPRKALDRKLFA